MDTITSFSGYFTYLTQTSQTQNWNGLLVPDSTTVFAFNDSISVAYGFIDLCAFVNLAGDADTGNNSMCKNIHGVVGIEAATSYKLQVIQIRQRM